MTRYVRVVLGRANSLASLGLDEGWVGTGWLGNIDLTGRFPDNWRYFNREFIEDAMRIDDISNRIGAGLACGMTWTVGAGLEIGDRVISRDTDAKYHVGEVTGPYEFSEGEPLPHRRPVTWFPTTFTLDDTSDALRRSFGSRSAVADVSEYGSEIESLVGDARREVVSVDVEGVENPMSFVLERHLEDFLVSNWAHTDLGKKYDILTIDGELVGQQFPTDTGPIDILAQSKDGAELLVVELKRGRVSDQVVGQILRYMGYVSEFDETKKVRGVIIGTEDDQKFRSALSMTANIEFMRYEVSFTLVKGS